MTVGEIPAVPVTGAILSASLPAPSPSCFARGNRCAIPECQETGRPMPALLHPLHSCSLGVVEGGTVFPMVWPGAGGLGGCQNGLG